MGGCLKVKQLEEKWQDISIQLKAAFSARSADEIKEKMKIGIALFMMYLFWTNGLPAHAAEWKAELTALKVKPVNTGERFEFILAQPALFHSYKQLEQLFIEQAKQYAKYQAIRSYK